MARGHRATPRQRVAGIKNIMKVNILRVGRRGTHYIRKMK